MIVAMVNGCACGTNINNPPMVDVAQFVESFNNENDAMEINMTKLDGNCKTETRKMILRSGARNQWTELEYIDVCNAKIKSNYSGTWDFVGTINFCGEMTTVKVNSKTYDHLHGTGLNVCESNYGVDVVSAGK